jgi:hypothetical protein
LVSKTNKTKTKKKQNKPGARGAPRTHDLENLVCRRHHYCNCRCRCQLGHDGGDGEVDGSFVTAMPPHLTITITTPANTTSIVTTISVTTSVTTSVTN